MKPRLISVIVLAVSLCPAGVHAQHVFTTVADSWTPVPGGGGANFSDFVNYRPTLSGGTVVFNSYGGITVGQGLFSWTDGTITILGENNTLIPSGTGAFTGYLNPAISGDTVVFRGGGGGGQAGIYTVSGGSIQVVVDNTGTPFPGGTTFGSFSFYPAISGDTVVFSGFDTVGHSGLFASTGGVLTTIVNSSTPGPGGIGTFNNIGNSVSISGSTVAFTGSPGFVSGVYTTSVTGGAVTSIADTNTIVPGGATTFFGFGTSEGNGPVISGDRVAFFGIASGGASGLFLSDGGTLSLVADFNTTLPGGGGTLSGITGFDVSDSAVVFLSTGTPTSAIYYQLDGGPLTRLIGVGDSLNGRTVSLLTLGQHALDGTQLTFQASFPGGTGGFYLVDLAPVPEPSSVLLLSAAGIMVWRCRRRRRGSVAGG